MQYSFEQRTAFSTTRWRAARIFILEKALQKMQQPTNPTSLLRKPQVLARVGIPKSSWDRGVRLGRFPKPVKIGVRAVAWTSTSIDELIEQLSSTVK